MRKLSVSFLIINVFFAIIYTLCLCTAVGFMARFSSVIVYCFTIDDNPIFAMKTINFVIPYFWAPICFWMIICESFFQLQNQLHFWKLVHDIDRNYNQHNNIFLRYYVYKFSEYFSCVCVCGAYAMYDHWNHNITAGFVVLIFIVTFANCGIRQLYYLFYVELIKIELKFIETEATQIFAACEMKFFREPYDQKTQIEQFDRSRFLWIREYYALIYQLHDFVNLKFGWSILGSFLCGFIRLMCDLCSIVDENEFEMKGEVLTALYIHKEETKRLDRM